MKKFKMVVVNKPTEQIAIDMINGAKYWNKDGTIHFFWSNTVFKNSVGGTIEIRGTFYEKVELTAWQDIIEEEYDAVTLPRGHYYTKCDLDANWTEEGFIQFCRKVIKAYDEGN